MEKYIVEILTEEHVTRFIARSKADGLLGEFLHKFTCDIVRGASLGDAGNTSLGPKYTVQFFTYNESSDRKERHFVAPKVAEAFWNFKSSFPHLIQAFSEKHESIGRNFLIQQSKEDILGQIT